MLPNVVDQCCVFVQIPGFSVVTSANGFLMLASNLLFNIIRNLVNFLAHKFTKFFTPTGDAPSKDVTLIARRIT